MADRILSGGPAVLSDVELLACALGRTRRHPDPQALASRLLADGREALARSDLTSLEAAGILGRRTTVRLAAIIELGRRFARPSISGRPLLAVPDAVGRYLHSRSAHWPQERVGALLLDSRHRLIVDREVVRGSVDSAVVTPRDVLRLCLLDGASSLILYHNHPSGDPTPSRDDIALTRALATASHLVGVRLVDHVVVGREGWVSLSSRGLMSP